MPLFYYFFITANGLRGWGRAGMSCPWVFCGRIATKPKGNGEIAYLPYGIRASYRWSLPLIRKLSQIYVLVIKPHCNDICAAFWAFGFYTAIPTLNPVFSERLREPLSMPENNVMRNYNNAWSRHFHLPQSPLVDYFYLSEASATRHTQQPVVCVS